MKFKNWLLGAAAAMAFGAVGTAAQAAPLGNVQADRAAGQSTAAEQAAWVRRCNWHRGQRHCRRVWRDYGYYDGGYYGGPYAYGPYGYGPAFGFSFGGGRNHGFGGGGRHGGGGHGGGGHR